MSESTVVIEEAVNTAELSKPKVKINWKYTIIFGLWTAAWSIIWGVYNTYMPIFWQSGNPNFNALGGSTAVGFGLGAFATSLIMSLDNISGAIMQPIFGAVGDSAKSRKRLVVIFGLLPAIFFALIPLAIRMIPPDKSGQLGALTLPLVLVVLLAMLMIFGWGVSTGAEFGFRYAVIPSAVRTQVYSYTAVFGGIAFVITFLFSNMLYKINSALPFWLGSAVLALTILLYTLFLKDPDESTLTAEDLEEIGAEKSGGFRALLNGLKLFSADQKRGFLIITVTKFLAWAGVAGLETFSSSYVVNNLGLNESAAGTMLAVYFVGYLLFAVPAGYIGAKVGRKNLLRIALLVFVLAGLVQYFTNSATLIYLVLIFAGAANSTVDIMVVPMIADVAPSKKVMGITVSSLASITIFASVVAVPAWGALIQALGNNFSVLWLGLAIMPAFAFLLISTLKSGIGEAATSETVSSDW